MTAQPDYVIVDGHTGQIVSKPYSYANRNRARARADRMDNEYGAYRYRATPTDLLTDRP